MIEAIEWKADSLQTLDVPLLLCRHCRLVLTFFEGRQHGHRVFIPQRFHICCHPTMCCGGTWRQTARWLQTAPLLPPIHQESLSARVAVANPDSSQWVSRLSSRFVPLGEEGGRGWPFLFRKSWSGSAVVEALDRTSDVHQSPCIVPAVGCTIAVESSAVFAHFNWANGVFVQPLSRTRFFPTFPQGRWAIEVGRGQETMQIVVHSMLMPQVLCTAALHRGSFHLQSSGLSGAV